MNKVTKSRLTRINRRLKEAKKKLSHLEARAKHGMMTEEEKHRKCNELAREFLRLSCEGMKLPYPRMSSYIEQACFDIAVRLKHLAVSASPKKGVRRSQDVRSKDIKRKVISKPSMRG